MTIQTAVITTWKRTSGGGSGRRDSTQSGVRIAGGMSVVIVGAAAIAIAIVERSSGVMTRSLTQFLPTSVFSRPQLAEFKRDRLDGGKGRRRVR